MMYGFTGRGMFGFGWLFGLLWIIVLVALVYLVIYSLNRLTHRARSPHSDAERILRERYARGEIDAATFQEMKQQLKKT